MNTYSITYRNTKGTMNTTTVKASTEADARMKFSAQYDGRIVVVEMEN